MKVIHLISGGDTGGARTHVHLLLKHLNRSMDAKLVCFMDGPFAQDAAALGIPTQVIGGNILSAIKTLRKMIQEEQYDVIHCHGSRGNLIGALLKPYVKVPIVSTVHSDPRLDYLGRPAARLTYGTLNRWALRKMDYHVGVSDSMRDLLISRGFDPCRIYTVYNGVEFSQDENSEAPDLNAFYRKVGLSVPEGGLVVGIAARLHPVKDYPTLLKGFSIAYQRYPNLRLLIAGDGQEKDNLLSLARDLGIAEAVCFAGWLNDMPTFYKAIDINALTSLSETFPYALTEGAREHLPTVSSNVGGIPALIQHGETGLLFQPGDAEKLGENLTLLASSAGLRKRLGDAIYEKARQEFSAEATALSQKEIYSKILFAEKQYEEYGRYGVLICGAYGMQNAGDEAILNAVLTEMREIDPDMPISVMSRRATETSLRYGVNAIYTFDLPRFLHTIRKRELYVNGGGSLLQDVTSSRSLWYYLFTIKAAKKRGCKVMMYGCGIGPVNRCLNRRLAGSVVDSCVDAISLREENSKEELRSFGVTRPKVIVASDPALSLEPASDEKIYPVFENCGMHPEGQYFCFSVRRWTGVKDKLDLFAAAADYVWEKYHLQPVLLSVNPRQDDRTSEIIREKSTAPCILVREPMESGVMVGFVGKMAGVLAMRLHVLIFAASRGVPLAAVSYDPKVASFLDFLAQENYLEYASLDNAEQLYSLIDRALQTDKNSLYDAAKRIKIIENQNKEMARELLGRKARS